MKRHKYNARKVEIDGHTFDSQKEARRYCALSLLQRAGEIERLELKPVFPIIIDGAPVKMRNGHTAKYTADFSYYQDNERVVEDCKGMITQDYRLRRALVEHIYRIRIREV